MKKYMRIISKSFVYLVAVLFYISFASYAGVASESNVGPIVIYDGGASNVDPNNPSLYLRDAWDNVNDYYNYLRSLGIPIPKNPNRKVWGIISKAEKEKLTSWGKPEENIDASEVNGYLPIFVADVMKDDGRKMAGIMITNGVDNKFVVIVNGNNVSSKYLTGWAVLSTVFNDRGWYHFDDDGKMTTGFMEGTDGNTYYFLEDIENRGMLATGVVTIGGVPYQFSDGADGMPYGAMIK